MDASVQRCRLQARNQDFMWGGANEAKVDQTTEMYFLMSDPFISICNYSLVRVPSCNITGQSRIQTPWSKCLSLQYLPVRHIQEPG